MALILNLLLFLTFLILALIHFNWALGGKWGFDLALPTDEQGIRPMTPGGAASAIVGLGLLTFGTFYLLQTGLINLELSDNLMQITSWIIPAIFLIRAVGEFHYVGFFKKIQHTPFGKMDTRFYSPLCVGIGIMGIVINLL